MSQRWFSSDFHLGFSALMLAEKWPFEDIKSHDEQLIASCEYDAKTGDIIIHVGDLATVGFDRHIDSKNTKGLMINNPMTLFKKVKADFINIRGNHDLSNNVKSVCDSMRTSLGKRYPNVSISHYPTYDRHCEGHFKDYDIHLCGHVHGKWKHCLDLDHGCLNINVGCMHWGFALVSEDELIRYVNFLFTKKPIDLIRAKAINGKIMIFKPGEKLEKETNNGI